MTATLSVSQLVDALRIAGKSAKDAANGRSSVDGTVHARGSKPKGGLSARYERRKVFPVGVCDIELVRDGLRCRLDELLGGTDDSRRVGVKKKHETSEGLFYALRRAKGGKAGERRQRAARLVNRHDPLMLVDTPPVAVE